MAALKPIVPAPGDATVGTTNADFAGQAALVVADARRLLDWADLTYAMDLEGVNSSVTPLFLNVQNNRPYKWLNWQAARVLAMIKGSYLFDDDPARIIQDPESLRASAVRQGSTWLAWARLRDTVTTAINWSDHNPAVSVGYSPGDAWELATPQALKYYVKAQPVAPSGIAIISTVEDLQGQTRLKVARAGQAVDDSFDLLGQDFLTAAFWMDVRQAQAPGRSFGPGPTAAWKAFRRVLPFKLDATPRSQPFAILARNFLADTAPSTLFSGGPAMPTSDGL